MAPGSITVLNTECTLNGPLSIQSDVTELLKSQTHYTFGTLPPSIRALFKMHAASMYGGACDHLQQCSVGA